MRGYCSQKCSFTLAGEMETSRCLPLVQAVRCSPGFRQDGMGCGLQSSSASFLAAVTPSSRVGLLLGDARLERGRGAGPVGWLEGHRTGSSSHGLGAPLTCEGRLSGPEESVSCTSLILETGRSGSMLGCWTGSRSPLLLPVSRPF